MKFKHFLLTRWNLLDPATDIYNYGIDDPDAWVRRRANLFERYCLPSVMNQTCQDFTWLLAFSQKTPLDITKRYRNLKNIKIIYEFPRDYLQNNYKGEWLLTSRLDNDDIYEPDCVEKIQENVKKSIKVGSVGNRIIDIDGVQWDMRVDKWYDSGRAAPNSPFMSLFENTRKPYYSIDPKFGLIKEKIKTVLYCSHTRMVQHFPSAKILKPLFVQCIHHENLANKINGGDLPPNKLQYWKSKYKI
ncbi:MAG TPA: hypothetical protein ENH82_18755 [bacterium]|nr:hypothetical protein [bacterium]